MPRESYLGLSMPILAIKGAICFTCLKPSNNLNRCAKCKRVWYCSQECQRKDWKGATTTNTPLAHKLLCQTLTALNTGAEECNIPNQSWEGYRKSKFDQMRSFELMRGSRNHQRMFYYEPYCASCYRSCYQMPKPGALTLCTKCNMAHHCQSCSSNAHHAHCSSLQAIASHERFIIQHYLETNESSVDMPTITPRATYLPLSAAPSWGYFFTTVSDKSMVKDLISPDLKPLVGNDEMACAFTAATYKMSRMLTIIAGLEAVFPSLATMEDLTLHIIGANAVELDALMMFEEIVHLLPALRKLHCVFVGIELPEMVDGNNRVSLNCCPPCTKSGRQRSMEMWKGAYHDLVSTSKLPRPDMAVAFHTGSSQTAVEEWTPTLKYLVNAGHATVFTTFNEDEMRGETQNLKKFGAKFIVEGERNRWQAMRPQLEVAERVENSIYYDHMYWYVLAGKNA